VKATDPAARAETPRLGRSRKLLGIFLLFLLLTLLVPGHTPVIDLITRQPVPEAGLAPIHPALQALTEPVLGPIHAFSALPLWRMLAVLVWLGLGIFGVRVALSLRAQRGIRGLVSEAGLFVGAYAPLAALPLVLYWSDLITKRTMLRFTPAGLPLAAYLVTLGIVLFRPGSRGRRLRLAWLATRAFLGIAGGIAFAVTILIYFVPRLVYQTGDRLVAPPGKLIFDLHAHGQQGDGLINGPERLDIFHRHGIQMTAVTEHNYFDQPENEKPFQTMQNLIRTRGYDMVALPGQEFTTHVCHLLLLGARKTYLPRDYRLPDFDRLTRVPPDYGYDFRRLVRDVHAEGAYAVAAHWWMPWTYYRLDWRHLVELGVDGFEVSSGADWAPRELVREWKASGQRLLAGTDFHGWHKSIYTWNLIDQDVINPDRKPLPDLDPWLLVQKIFESRASIPVAAATFSEDWPVWLEPPALFWHYFADLRLPGRLMWAVVALALWGFGWLRRRNRGGASAPAEAPSFRGEAKDGPVIR
jgi:hypothetical protein